MEKIYESILLDADFQVEGPMLIYSDPHPNCTSPDSLVLERRKFKMEELAEFEHASHVYVLSDEKIKDGDIYYWPEHDILNSCSNFKNISPEDKKVIASTDPDLVIFPHVNLDDMQKIASFYYSNKRMPKLRIGFKTMVFGQCNCICHQPGAMVMHIMACCNPTIKEVPSTREDGSLDIIELL